MTAANSPDSFPFNFEEIIEVNEKVLLVVEVVNHAIIGESIQIKQFLRVEGKTSFLGAIFIPLNRLSLGALKILMRFCEEKISAVSPHSILAKFFAQGFEQARFPPPTSQPLPYTVNNYQGAKVNPERLQEKITGTSFILEDLVHALQENQPFSQKLSIPLDQVKVLLYYGFLGKRPMITRDVEKLLLQTNINYDYKRTGMLLKELVTGQFIDMVERLSKNNRTYRLYTWPSKRFTPFLPQEGL